MVTDLAGPEPGTGAEDDEEENSSDQPPPQKKAKIMAGERELTTGLLAKNASFRLIVTGEIGVKEIERLIKKLELDKEILAEQATENEEAAKPATHDGFVVDYNDEVTEERVRKIDDLLEEEFKDGEWVTVEQES